MGDKQTTKCYHNYEYINKQSIMALYMFSSHISVIPIPVLQTFEIKHQIWIKSTKSHMIKIGKGRLMLGIKAQ